VPTHGTGGYRRIGAKLELIGKQRLHAAIVHYHHHQVNGLPANLQTNASTGCGQGRRSAPASRRATGCHAAAMRAANYKPALKQIGHHCHALCRSKNV
jgi:hypothetical protein